MDSIKAIGSVELDLYRDGVLIDQRKVSNLVVTAGKFYIAERVAGVVGTNLMNRIAVGTNDANTTLAMQALTTEISRVACDSGFPTATGSTANFVATFGAGVGTGLLKEAGIFNDTTGGDMLCRTTFPVINKEAPDSLTIRWNITIN